MNRLSEETHRGLEMLCTTHPRLSDREIAAMAGVSRTVVWTYRSSRQGKRNPNWKRIGSEKVAAIVLSLRGGLTYREIADSAHSSVSTVAAGAIRPGPKRGGPEPAAARRHKASRCVEVRRPGQPAK